MIVFSVWIALAGDGRPAVRRERAPWVLEEVSLSDGLKSRQHVESRTDTWQAESAAGHLARACYCDVYLLYCCRIVISTLAS